MTPSELERLIEGTFQRTGQPPARVILSRARMRELWNNMAGSMRVYNPDPFNSYAAPGVSTIRYESPWGPVEVVSVDQVDVEVVYSRMPYMPVAGFWDPDAPPREMRWDAPSKAKETPPPKPFRPGNRKMDV